MRSKHPRLAKTFENGKRRCDYEACVALVLEMHPRISLEVKDFMYYAMIIGFSPEYKQMARVLRQMADDGKIWSCSRDGNYRYMSIEDQTWLPV